MTIVFLLQGHTQDFGYITTYRQELFQILQNLYRLLRYATTFSKLKILYEALIFLLQRSYAKRKSDVLRCMGRDCLKYVLMLLKYLIEI